MAHEIDQSDYEQVQAERLADPDPRPVIERRILNGTLRPDLTTHAEVFQWWAREKLRRDRESASMTAAHRKWEDEIL